LSKISVKLSEKIFGGFDRMRRFLFLILLVMSAAAFAQAQEKKDAYEFFEYEKISHNLLKEKISSFCDEVDKTSYVGWFINYGTSKEIAKREKQILDTRVCTKEFPSPRIRFLRVEENNKSKTEFWIVPPGEEPPPVKK